MKKLKVDIPFFISIIVLVVAGYLIFASASLGLLSKQAAKYSNVAFNQTFFGLLLGSIACFVTTQIDYRIYRKFAFYVFIASCILTLMVFVPHIGVGHGGAQRWINIGVTTFQPSEFLKIGFILYFAAWLTSVKDKASTLKYGLFPFVAILGVVGLILLLQPDTDTFMVIVFAGIAMYLTGGGKWKYIFALGLIGVIGLAGLALARPYVMSRIMTFVHPDQNAQGSGYQIQQSLIAIGSGGLVGRGFGQSIQKFNVLPEPIGDSIFAVASEEFGFIGATFIILLFVFLPLEALN